MQKKAISTEHLAGLQHLILGKGEENRGTGSLENRQNLLASRLKAGEHAAAAELVDIYYEQIYRFMRRLGHSREVGEDLTQETFFQAWNHLGQLRSGKALGGWLYQPPVSAEAHEQAPHPLISPLPPHNNPHSRQAQPPSPKQRPSSHKSSCLTANRYT